MNVLRIGACVLVALCITASSSLAETHTARNTLYIEMGGAGMVYSLNYDRLVTDHLSLRAGMTEVWSIFLLPMTVNALIGSGAHNFEIGGGVVAAAGDGEFHVVGKGASMLLVGFVGYRFQPLGGGLNFRVGAQPLIVTGPDGGGIVWGGMSFGASF